MSMTTAAFIGMGLVVVYGLGSLALAARAARRSKKTGHAKPAH